MVLVQYGKKRLRLIVTTDLILEPAQWSNTSFETLGLAIFREPVADEVELLSKAFNISKRETRQNFKSFKLVADINDLYGQILTAALENLIPYWIIGGYRK